MRQFREFCEKLRKKYPTRYPVRIAIIPRMGDYGRFDFRDGDKPFFSVRIKKREYGVMIHTLMEEYAHALAWSKEKKDHDKAWSDRYSQIRQWWDRENES